MLDINDDAANRNMDQRKHYVPRPLGLRLRPVCLERLTGIVMAWLRGEGRINRLKRIAAGRGRVGCITSEQDVKRPRARQIGDNPEGTFRQQARGGRSR